jgi:hypothetical protein
VGLSLICAARQQAVPPVAIDSVFLVFGREGLVAVGSDANSWD